MSSNAKAEGCALFSAASKAEKLDACTYAVNLDASFCIGAVPNGGYTASCMVSVGSAHLSSRNQPDMLTAHFEYPNRAAVGPAVVSVEQVKLGRQVSLLHLTLWQDGLAAQAPWITPSSRRILLAYATYTNLSMTDGLSLPTGYQATSLADLPPLPDLGALKQHGGDKNWREEVPSTVPLLTSVLRWHFYVPRNEPFAPGVLDMWVCFRSGEKIMQNTLAYVLDSFPHSVHSWIVAPELREFMKPPIHQEDRSKVPKGDGEPRAAFWFPTVVMNLEVKRALPPEGVEWLHVRITGKQIQHGRADMDFVVRDLHGEMVAQAQHVFMIVSSERNYQSRKAKATL